MNLSEFKTNITLLDDWLIDKGMDMLIAIVVGVLVYYIGRWIISRLTKSLLKSAKQREWHKKDISKRQKTLIGLFVTIWRMVVIFSVVYALLRINFGETISTTFAPLFASAGIIGITIGIGAQSLIKDFLSGIFIISENQYRVGDTVEIEGFSGTVERIGARSTVLRDVDGNVHFFPNGMVQHVMNKTMGYSMARFSLIVKPTTDIDKVSDIIDSTGLKLSKEGGWKDKIIEPPAFVSMGDFNALSVEIIIAGKTQPSDQWSVIAEMRRRLLDQFDKHNVELATPPAAQAPKK